MVADLAGPLCCSSSLVVLKGFNVEDCTWTAKCSETILWECDTSCVTTAEAAIAAVERAVDAGPWEEMYIVVVNFWDGRYAEKM